MAGLLKFLNFSKADIMGFSNGGQTAMQMGISHPELVNKLIIISAFYKREGAYPWQWQAMFNRDSQRMLHFKDWKDEDIQSVKARTIRAICLL